ncbi:hypothetical protein VUR80DRAFT_5176 [Thermomyces stellatus]
MACLRGDGEVWATSETNNAAATVVSYFLSMLFFLPVGRRGGDVPWGPGRRGLLCPERKRRTHGAQATAPSDRVSAHSPGGAARGHHLRVHQRGIGDLERRGREQTGSDLSLRAAENGADGVQQCQGYSER